MLMLLVTTGVAMGLLLSACVSSPDRASTLLPYVLIPQIILAGGIMPVEEEPLHAIALLGSPAYWAYRAVRTGESSVLPPDFPGYMEYAYGDGLLLACAALVAQTGALLFLTAWFLRRKDAWK
jgi:hypothetical protein